MFCPQCKKKYPQGTMVCARCHVGLRSVLPEESAREAIEDVALNQAHQEEPPLRKMTFPSNRIGGFLVELWSGEDLALHARLRETLDEAGIPYFNKPAGNFPGVRWADPVPMLQRPRFGFTLAVQSEDLSAAREILEKLLEEEPQDELELADRSDQPEASRDVVTDGEEDVTTEIWSGSDAALSGFIGDALKENGIANRCEAGMHGTTLFVTAANEMRAREVVREIVESEPPE
jgi:hypothetical protein